MQLHFDEQDVVDACCVFVANRYRDRPENILVDLSYEPGQGFGAEAKAGFQSVRLSQQEMVDAVAEYLAEYHNFNARDLQIDLQFPDENRIEAYIVVR